MEGGGEVLCPQKNRKRERKSKNWKKRVPGRVGKTEDAAGSDYTFWIFGVGKADVGKTAIRKLQAIGSIERTVMIQTGRSWLSQHGTRGDRYQDKPL